MSKIKVATIWLDGCSGCHMSFLDMDERLVELSQKIEYVSGPYIDVKFKDFPEVDLTLVEGAVSNEDDLHKICVLREKTKLLLSFGDCAVTGNVSSMRNIYGAKECLAFSYIGLANENNHIPDSGVPKLLPVVKPVHEVVEVDHYLPGCPPPADAIYYVLTELIEGRVPNPYEVSRFGK